MITADNACSLQIPNYITDCAPPEMPDSLGIKTIAILINILTWDGAGSFMLYQE